MNQSVSLFLLEFSFTSGVDGATNDTRPPPPPGLLDKEGEVELRMEKNEEDESFTFSNRRLANFS